ncbi:MAG: TIR domain-containing protein [Anaerolineae bacterium]
MLAVLEILQGPDAYINGVHVGKQVEIRDKWVSVGRNPRQATIQLYNIDETSSVSRLHCTLELHEALKCFFITDEGSSSGTKVAGRSITANKPHSLKDGDTIELGMMDKQGAILRFHTNLNPPERISVESNIDPKTTIRQNLASLSPKSTEPVRQDVFISYSRKDREQMHLIRAGLTAAKLTVWSDEILEPGTPHWRQDVQLAIEGAGCLVAILSPDAKSSEWVGEELNYARIRKLRIFTVLIRGDESNAIPFGLTGVQWIDMRSDYEQEITPLVQQSAIQQLVIAVQEHLGKT